MAQNENFDELFNPSVDMGAAAKSNLVDYTPSAAKGKNKVYQSLVRLIPWHEDPKKSIMEKWTCWLVDPISQKGKFVDCPSSIGKPSLLQDMYWKLKKSDSVQQQKAAEIFSRRHAFSSLVQIIKDDNQPELEGKILVWKYGKKVWDKINGELKPLIGDPHNPFDLLKGKIFALVITEVSGFNNYDQSKFVDKSIGLCIPNEQGKLIPINEKTDKASVLEFLKENSPELSKFGFKEWDADTHDYVNAVITQVTGKASESSNYASLQSTTNETKTSKPAAQKAKTSGITSSDISLEEIDGLGDIGSVDMPELGGIGGDLDEALSGL
jgi:hypothetical protein